MSDSLNRAEALLNNFELKVRADYGSTTDHHPSEVGQEIPEAPDHISEAVVEAGKSFREGLENATPFATDQELDEAEVYFEQAFNNYREAIDSHLDHINSENLVDVDLVIDQALNGYIDEDSVVEAAGLQSFVVDDLRSDQSHVRRNMDDQDAYEFLEESSYDTESVVRDNYLQDIGEAQDLVEEGIAEIR